MTAGPDRCLVCLRGRTRPLPNAFHVPTWRCRACGSGFVWPVPDEGFLEARYESEHARGIWAERFATHDPREFERRAAWVAGVVGEPGRLLDIGCGDGEFLAAWLGRGGDGVGLELSRVIAGAAARRAPGAEVVVGYLDAVAEGPSFRAATFWDVLEHVPDPTSLVRAAAARLEPGGVVAASLPNYRSLTAVLHGGAWEYLEFARYGHLTHFSPVGLTRVFERAGLVDVAAETAGSTDLRDVPRVRWGLKPGRVANYLLDRASGLAARVAVPLGWGNTLLISGRKPF